jgi:hypothetical protein
MLLVAAPLTDGRKRGTYEQLGAAFLTSCDSLFFFSAEAAKGASA